MNEPQSNDSKAPLRTVSRRAVLPGLILGIAGINTAVIRFFIPEATQLTDPQADKPKSPRFPKHKKVTLTTIGLSPGFYMNPASGVIHYLSGAPIPQFKIKNEKRLTSVNPTIAEINLA